MAFLSFSRMTAAPRRSRDPCRHRAQHRPLLALRLDLAQDRLRGGLVVRRREIEQQRVVVGRGGDQGFHGAAETGGAGELLAREIRRLRGEVWVAKFVNLPRSSQSAAVACEWWARGWRTSPLCQAMK